MGKPFLSDLYHYHRTNQLPPEGSVTEHLARAAKDLAPDSRATIGAIIRDTQLAREGFREPFKPAIEKGKELDTVAAHHGLGRLSDDDRAFGERLFDALDQEEVTVKLMSRMGVDTQKPLSLDSRDYVEAAFNAITGDTE